MYEIFAELLRTHKISAYKVAKETGITQATLSRWKTGKVSPSVDTLQLLADYFGVSVDYLLGNTPHQDLRSLINTGLTEPSVVANHFPTEASRLGKYTVNYNPIMKNIKERMATQGITASELAALSGVCEKNIISLLEGEDPHLSPLEINCLGAALNVDLMTPYMENTTAKKKSTLDAQEWIRKNAIPIGKMKPIPVIGVIRAGMPMLAEENIEYYDFADVSDANDYFYLRVLGDSMIGAGIPENSIVLIKKQNSAENGQIVACLVNGEDATLKRFKQQGKTVLLMPENSKYEPIVLSCDDFENGYAKILGVAKEVKVKLQ